MFRRLGIGVLFLGLRALVHGLRLRLPQTAKPSTLDIRTKTENLNTNVAKH